MSQIEVIPVVAYGLNRVIGRTVDGKQTLSEWNLAADRKHFKDLTSDKKGPDGRLIKARVGFGRKTFESLPSKYRPLPNRDNIIFTRNKDYIPNPTNERTFVTNKLVWAIYRAGIDGYDKFYIAGGEEIYKEILNQLVYPVNKIIATEVQAEFEGDAFFPELEAVKWEDEIIQKVSKDENNSHDFNIVHYTRIAT